jgi:outer membrane protein assembly factor BamB
VITAFDLEARRERWRFALAEGGSVALRLTVDRDTVYVPHLGGRLVALSVADGHQRWQIGGLSDGLSWAPAVVGDVAYAAARAGLFACSVPLGGAARGLATLVGGVHRSLRPAGRQPSTA